MGKYLVTGAAGFIGAALAKALLSQGHDVVTIDNLSTGYLTNLPKRIVFYQGDCQDAAIYEQLPISTYDAIFHIAGQSSGEISFDDPVYDLRTNTESTLHLLKFALKVNCKRFIYASSMSVYGHGTDRPVAESAKTVPQSFYAIGKLASEQYLKIYAAHGIQATSLRFFNVYGPGQNMQNLRQGMVSIYLAQLLQKNKIDVRGDANRFRDFIYIDDVVSACRLCLSQPASIGQSINIGTGIKTTVSELIDMLMTLTGKLVPVTYSQSTPGDLFGIYADISFARTYLGFNPEYTLMTGLRKMVEWAKNTASHQLSKTV